MSSDKEQEYFSDGISEELLNLLAQVPELRVIARTSSFSFKGKDVDIAEIASRLNVANVLEGSVRKSGDTLRITAQLVRASDSSHLWSQTYDRQMSDVFKVQDEIAAAVVAQLKIKLLAAAPKTTGDRSAGLCAFPAGSRGHAAIQCRGDSSRPSRSTSRRWPSIRLCAGVGRAGRRLLQPDGLRPGNDRSGLPLAREAINQALAMIPATRPRTRAWP